MKKQTLGKRIKELRTLKKMNQVTLGEKLFVSNKTISKWENDLSEPSSEILQRMAELFEVTTDYLIGGETKKVNSNKKSIYELACKYDDVTLLEGLDLSLPDEQGKNISYYAYKTGALNVIRYISSFDDQPVNLRTRKGALVLLGNHKSDKETIVLSIRHSKEEIDKCIKDWSESGYINLRVLNMLGSVDECRFDLDRIRFEMLNGSGEIEVGFSIIAFNDYESACLRIEQYRKDRANVVRYHYVKPKTYKTFLDNLYEIDFANWKGEYCGMPICNIIFTKKDMFPNCKNLAYVKPSPDNYKKLISSLIALLVESCRFTAYVQRILPLINMHAKPYYFEGVRFVDVKKIVEYIEQTTADCVTDIEDFYF